MPQSCQSSVCPSGASAHHSMHFEAETNTYLLLLVCRYYVAEGVRIYSQETWKDVTDGHGRELVEQHISPTVTAVLPPQNPQPARPLILQFFYLTI